MTSFSAAFRRKGPGRPLVACVFLVPIAQLSEIPLARAGGTTLAEPIIEENITDIDAVETGTLEIDVTGALVRGRGGRGGGWAAGFEAEWRAIDRLGLGGELSTGGATTGLSPETPAVTSMRGAASYVFLRDAARRIYLQAEATGRYDAGSSEGVDFVTEAELPYTFGLRWATELGPLTLRGAAFGEAGGGYAHAPVRASTAVLFELSAPSGRRPPSADLRSARSANRVYLGGEAMADGARAAPLLLVPEALLLIHPFGPPVRIGVGLPIGVHPRQGDGSFGFALRVVFEPDE